MSRVKAKDRRAFIGRARTVILEVGATPFDDGFAPERRDTFELTTKAGRLVLNLDKTCQHLLGTVFARFDDEKAAKQLVDCNPFSGKWNFHYFDVTVDDAIHNLESSLRSIL